jgi:hypothetical protein
MLEAITILKGFCTTPVLPGLFMLMMGLGVAPVDEGMAKAAAVFIDPVGIPQSPFFILLGTCKILGGLSLWGIGPMPEKVGKIGLAVAATCGAIGHFVAGDPWIPPLVYNVMLGSLVYMEKSAKGKEE